MNHLHHFTAALSLAMAAAFAAHAQTPPPVDHAAHHAASAPTATPLPQSEGEVRKIQREASKVTLRHGPLTNLDMPAMTMVFTVADQKLLDGLKEGDKVRFTAERLDGTIRITALRVVR